MQFTNLDDLKNTVQQHSIKHNEQLHSTMHCFSTDQYQIDFQEALDNINEINIARSLPLYQQDMSMEVPEEDMQKSNTYVDYFQQKQQLSPIRIKSKSPKKSSIFSRKTSTAISLDSSIRVYYFELPLSKSIKLEKKTTTRDLIKMALHAYSVEQNFDQSKLFSNDPDFYELRIPKEDAYWVLEPDAQPIRQNRFISQSLHQNLILVAKQNFHAQGKINLLDNKIYYNSNGNKITITLYNQLKNQVGKIQLSRDQNLAQVFDLVENNEFFASNYFLCQQIGDQFVLTRDFEVKNLSSPNIYIKSIVYQDREESQKPKPFKVMQNIPKIMQTNIVPPIGITQASMYQEFEVMKLNRYGMEQQRILGIDQSKIYNYQKSVRKQQKSVSLFDKIRGINEQFGTKKPCRPISQLKSVSCDSEKIIMNYIDKKVIYVQKDQLIRNKILRKLNFLLAYHGKH